MKEKLLQLGFNKTETEVYLYVISHGRVTPAMISKDTGIKRPTVYAAASELVRRGIMHEDLGSKSKYLVAKPRDLEKLVVEQRQKVLTEEALVADLLPELKDLASQARSPIPRVQYVRESDLKDFFYKQSMIWNESMLATGETSWWGYDSDDITRHAYVQEWLDWYWPKTSRKIELRLLSPHHESEERISKKLPQRRYMKYWDERSDASQWVVGDYIIMVVTKQKPHYAIQIKDHMMAESLRRTYRKLWSLIE